MSAHQTAPTATAALQHFRRGCLALIAALFLLPVCRTASAAPGNGSTVEVNWGGHLRAIATATAIDDQPIYQYADTGPYYDGQAELRLKSEIFMGSYWSLETHYEAVAAGGDTRENTSKLRRMFPGQFADACTACAIISDDQRFFNLTHPLVTEDDYIVYHRLDRLNLTYTPSWGSLRIGRQALTWGNGMIFNPMDLFNPFAPTTVQRDYKAGDDMVLGQAYIGRHEGQVLYAPRRDADSGELRDSQSSYAGKLHLSLDGLETDIMAARHHDDHIVAWGATGDLGDAAWRLNAVYTFVNEEYRRDDFLQAVANLDYAWVWGGKNVYGLLEFYYNGLGRGDDYDRAVSEPYTRDRLSRGDLFTSGRYYMAGLLQIELHPLLHNDWTVIVNLKDPSGLVLPQLLWDVTTNTQVILGAQLHWGAEDTEYGGFDTSLAGRTVRIAPQDRIYLWLTCSF
jgi:hypothetical protein